MNEQRVEADVRVFTVEITDHDRQFPSIGGWWFYVDERGRELVGGSCLTRLGARWAARGAVHRLVRGQSSERWTVTVECQDNGKPTP